MESNVGTSCMTWIWNNVHFKKLDICILFPNLKLIRDVEDRALQREEARARLDSILIQTMQNNSELQETFNLVS